MSAGCPSPCPLSRPAAASTCSEIGVAGRVVGSGVAVSVVVAGAVAVAAIAAAG